MKTSKKLELQIVLKHFEAIGRLNFMTFFSAPMDQVLWVMESSLRQLSQMMDHNRRPQEGAPRGSLVIDAVTVVGLTCPTAVEIPLGENFA